MWQMWKCTWQDIGFWSPECWCFVHSNNHRPFDELSIFNHMFLHHLHDVFLCGVLFSRWHMVSKWLSSMARTMTRGANQLTLRWHMLPQEDKPMDSENSSFFFQVLLMLAIVPSLWCTLIGWVYFIHRLARASILSSSQTSRSHTFA